jgi:hypothetical protein
MRRRGGFQEEGVLRQASGEAEEAASGLRKSEGSARASPPGSTQATFPDQRPEPARKGFICYAERDGRNRQQR